MTELNEKEYMICVNSIRNKKDNEDIEPFNYSSDISESLLDTSKCRKVQIMKLYKEGVLLPLSNELHASGITLEDIVNEFHESVSQIILSSKFRSFENINEYYAFLGEQFMKLYSDFSEKSRALSLEIRDDK